MRVVPILVVLDAALVPVLWTAVPSMTTPVVLHLVPLVVKATTLAFSVVSFLWFVSCKDSVI